MPECIFCEIGKKKIPVRTVHEDEKTIAFLDITPRSVGMCLVIPKQHMNTFDENIEITNDTFNAALVVGKKLLVSLQPLTVLFSIIPAKAPHFQVRVYPLYEDQIPLIENKPIEVSEGELDELAKKINSAHIEMEKPEPQKEEKPEAVGRKLNEENRYWLKRHQEVA